MEKFIIKDWAGNIIHLPGFMRTFPTFEEAEDALCFHLGDNYEKARCSYDVTTIEN